MELIEKTISNLISSQFPEFYQEEGPIFILFVQKYYEWLEQPGNVLYQTRRIFENRDIDECTDKFLVFFKETYLKNIQLDTTQNIRQLIKHSLDLYRSKGSERALRLLFQAAFGVTPSVYYPGDDIFKLSDGEWVIPTYLEISPSQYNVDLVNKQVEGTISGATAFVDAVVRQSGKTISDILYISDLNSNFKTGEQLILSYNHLSARRRPTVIGSLNDVSISTEGIGSGFAVGDLLENIQSAHGFGAKGRVNAVSTTTGVVGFSLLDGGYGFSNQTTVIVSENVLNLTSVVNQPVLFEQISQNLATFPYVNANGGFQKDDTLTVYFPNNAVRGTARVLTINATNSSSGNLFIEVLTGNVSANAIFTNANAVAANLNLITGYVDQTATANIMGITVLASNNVKVGVFNESNQFVVGVHYTTNNSNSTGILSSISTGSGANLGISNTLLYTEIAAINSDKLKTYSNVQLNVNYGFPAFPTGNSTTNIATCLSYSNITFGKVQSLVSINPGSNYNDKPFVTIYDPISLPMQRQDMILNYANATVAFAVGELITQASSNARGIVTSSSLANSTLFIENLRVLSKNDFVITVDANSTIVGTDSGAIANCTAVKVDFTSAYLGNNVSLDVKLTSFSGAITDLQIIDSGFGYQNNEVVTIVVGNNVIGTGFAVLNRQGMGSGYYRKKGGFLSDSKKIFDGYYYQNYSYDISSSIALERYANLLKNVTHQAGKIFFGTFVHQVQINTNLNNVTASTSKV